MNKLQPAETVINASRSEFRKSIIAAGGTRKEADKMYRDAKHQETYVNSLYVVQINRDCNHGWGGTVPGGMFELTLRRQDRGPLMDWRDIQQIKNQLVGDECEMVQLFPAEERLRDSANQYWFYGFNNKEVRFPFGMFGRVVNDGNDFGNSKQRKLG